MQQPTSEAIKDQVSAELDNQLSEKVVVTALKTSSSKKTKKEKEGVWHKSYSTLQIE